MIEDVLRMAVDAGAEILQRYGSVASKAKTDQSPLTEADMASHRLIVGRLDRLTPSYPVVSEESDPACFAMESCPEAFWLVDPLDGTKEFLKQSGEFTVNIALVRAGRPVLGVVLAPAIGLTYWALEGQGAWKRQGETAPQRIQTRPVDPERLVFVASRDHAGPGVERLLGRFPQAQTTSMGSSLKFCLVAEGAADLYLRDLPTMEWDTAAAHCVLEAAGGGVKDLQGRPFRYGKPTLKNPGFAALGDVRSGADREGLFAPIFE